MIMTDNLLVLQNIKECLEIEACYLTIALLGL